MDKAGILLSREEYIRSRYVITWLIVLRDFIKPCCWRLIKCLLFGYMKSKKIFSKIKDRKSRILIGLQLVISLWAPLLNKGVTKECFHCSGQCSNWESNRRDQGLPEKGLLHNWRKRTRVQGLPLYYWNLDTFSITLWSSREINRDHSGKPLMKKYYQEAVI